RRVASLLVAAPVGRAGRGNPLTLLLVVRAGLLKTLQRGFHVLPGVRVLERANDRLQPRDTELTRQRELERLHHPAPYRPALVVQVRGEHLERVSAAARRQRRQHVRGAAVRTEPLLDARDGCGVSRLGDDAVRRFLDHVLVRGRDETTDNNSITSVQVVPYHGIKQS